jgi:hypothetical protein
VFYVIELFFVGAGAGAFRFASTAAPCLAPILTIVASVFTPIMTSFASVLTPVHAGCLSLCI